VKGTTAVTLVIVVAAIGALVLLLSIVALSRSRFADESERFRYVSDLTSQWSRQRQAEGPVVAASGGEPKQAIDLRDVTDVTDVPAATADPAAARERR
jgi:hypothetical protein